PADGAGLIKEIGAKPAPDGIRHQAEIGEVGDIGFGEIEFGETGGRAFRIEDVKLKRRRIEDRGQRVVAELLAVDPEIILAHRVVEIAIEMYRRFFGAQDGDLAARLRRSGRRRALLHLQKRHRHRNAARRFRSSAHAVSTGTSVRAPHSAHDPSYNAASFAPATVSARSSMAAVMPEPQVVTMGSRRSTPRALNRACISPADFSVPSALVSSR